MTTTTGRAQSRGLMFRWLPLAVIGGLTALFAAAATVAYYI